MNEKIKELIAQATTEEHGVIQPRQISTVYHFDKEKFAELIVRECLDIVDDEGCGEGGSVRAVQKIREHFGVDQ